jgi:hypothetical protein
MSGKSDVCQVSQVVSQVSHRGDCRLLMILIYDININIVPIY